MAEHKTDNMLMKILAGVASVVLSLMVFVATLFVIWSISSFMSPMYFLLVKSSHAGHFDFAIHVLITLVYVIFYIIVLYLAIVIDLAIIFWVTLVVFMKLCDGYTPKILGIYNKSDIQ